MGSVVSSVGKAVSGVTGAVGGLIGSATGGLANGVTSKVQAADPAAVNSELATSRANDQNVANLLTSLNNRANIANADASQSRTQQQNALSLAQQAALGNAPSVAQLQLQNNTNRGISQLAAQQAAGAGGMNAALAARNIARAGASMQAQQNSDSATLRAQEMAAARDSYANQTANARNQDLSNVNSVTNSQNTGLGLQQTSSGQRLNALTGQANNQQQANVANTATQNNTMGSLLSAGGTIAAGLIGGSDRNLKQDIKPADKKIENFLNSIKAESYTYKNKDFGEKEYISPMAQDLEKTKVGDSMVIDTPEGKMVDYSKGFATMLSAQSNLNSRINDLEKALSKKKGAK